MLETLSAAELAELPPKVRKAFMAQTARIEALEAGQTQHVQLEQRVGELEVVNARLEYLVAEFRKLLFAKRSEKLDADQRELAFEDLEIARAEAETASEAARPDTLRPARKRNLGRLPEHLERVEEVIEPESTLCPCGCGTMVYIGEDRSERLDVVPARLRVIVTVRPKYACRRCERGVVQALAPARLIEGALPTEALLAQVLVGKFCDHLPLYRQAQGFARAGIDIDRSTLADWIGKAAFHLRPLADRLSDHLKASSHLFMDETTLPVLDPGRGKTKTGYLWTLTRDERGFGGTGPPGVVYVYAPGRGGQHAENILEGFTGTLSVDGYAGYNRLAKNTRCGGPVRLAHCWAHARRKLEEIYDHDGSPIAKAGLDRIARFYAIETEIRGASCEHRLAIRQERAAPLVTEFFEWLAIQRARISKRSRLGEKLSYIERLRPGLMVYLDDGRVGIDNNPVENRIRPIALGRKNALFAGHDEGARSWATIASLIETCKLNDVEPFVWLKTTLEAIARGHPMSRLDDLLPGAFACAN